MCYDCVNKIVREAVDMNNDNAIMTSGLQDFRTSGLQDFRTGLCR